MKLQSRTLIGILLFGIAMQRCLVAETNSSSGIKIEFAPDAILSSNELAAVIRLARQCGVSNVVEVSTYNNRLPSPDFSIGVSGAETIRGRSVSSVFVQIEREKWSSKDLRKNVGVFKSIGEFWVAPYGVSTNVSTIFKIPGGTTRARMPDKLPLATADKIITAFVTGRIRYSAEDLKEKLKGVDFSKPVSLGNGSISNKGMYSICYSPWPSTLYWLDITLDSEGVTIVDVHKIVS